MSDIACIKEYKLGRVSISLAAFREAKRADWKEILGQMRVTKASVVGSKVIYEGFCDLFDSIAPGAEIPEYIFYPKRGADSSIESITAKRKGQEVKQDDTGKIDPVAAAVGQSAPNAGNTNEVSLQKAVDEANSEARGGQLSPSSDGSHGSPEVSGGIPGFTEDVGGNGGSADGSNRPAQEIL